MLINIKQLFKSRVSQNLVKITKIFSLNFHHFYLARGCNNLLGSESCDLQSAFFWLLHSWRGFPNNSACLYWLTEIRFDLRSCRRSLSAPAFSAKPRSQVDILWIFIEFILRSVCVLLCLPVCLPVSLSVYRLMFRTSSIWHVRRRCYRDFLVVSVSFNVHVSFREGGMDVSLFKRLSERHPHAVVNLEHQYRMHKDIMLLSNTLIYEHRLKCGTEETAERLLDLPNWDFLRETISRVEKQQGQIFQICILGIVVY